MLGRSGKCGKGESFKGSLIIKTGDGRGVDALLMPKEEKMVLARRQAGIRPTTHNVRPWNWSVSAEIEIILDILSMRKYNTFKDGTPGYRHFILEQVRRCFILYL